MNQELPSTRPPSSSSMQYGLLTLFGLVTAVAMLITAVIAKLNGSDANVFYGIMVCVIVVLGVWCSWLQRSIVPTVLGICSALLFAYLFFDFSFMQAARVQPPRNPCTMKAKQLGIALLNYVDAHKTLPPVHLSDPQGKPLHSWRTLILPYIEEGNLYKEFRLNEPWNSSHNMKISQKPVDMYLCPSDKGAGRYDTSYVAVVGPDTAWGTGRRNPFAFKDGSANTILLIEMKNSHISWAEPRDLDLSNLPPGITKANLLQSLSNHPNGIFHAVFADGHEEIIPTTIPWSQFEALLTRSGGEKIDRSTW